MFQSITRRRFRRLVLATAFVAATIVPTATGGTLRPPDVQDAARSSLVVQTSQLKISLRKSPTSQLKTRFAGSGRTVAAPDVLERYAAAHPYGIGLVSQDVSVPRPPDVTDASLAAQYSSVDGSINGFSWGDWGIGIASGIGIALLAGAGLATGRQVRQGVRTA